MKGDKIEKKEEKDEAEKCAELREINLESIEISLPENSVWAVFIRRLRECSNPESFELTQETIEELELLVEKIFADKPIIDIPEEEVELLKKYFKDRYLEHYQILIERFKSNINFLEKEEYIAEIMNPETDPTIVSRNGSRGIWEYEHFGVNVVDIIRKQIAQGKERVKVLDIGSASARILAELKLLPEFNGKIEIYALSPEPEPHYAVDGYYQYCGEYLPEEFRNRFDVIVSNMALIYSYFPDHAIRGAFQALAEGGEAQLNIPHYRSPDLPRHEKEIRKFAEDRGIGLGNDVRNRRILKAYDDIKKMAIIAERNGSIFCICK